jgi:hypothetical protein
MWNLSATPIFTVVANGIGHAGNKVRAKIYIWLIPRRTIAKLWWRKWGDN